MIMDDVTFGAAFVAASGAALGWRLVCLAVDTAVFWANQAWARRTMRRMAQDFIDNAGDPTGFTHGQYH